jgi:CDP-glucose 4,6-dehydratase
MESLVVMSRVDIQNNFWKGKKVFLTGHTGFKGGWLALWLSEMGAKVFGFSLAPDTEPAMFHAAGIESASSLSQFGDIRNREQLKLAMVQSDPDLVFHLAAQPLVRHSYQNPVETYQTNVMGTVHVLDTLRYINNARAVVVVTTDKCYENDENLRAYEETDPMGGHDPYSSSKGCAELITAAYRRSFFSPTTYKDHGVAIATARAGNVIGGGDWSTDRLIPDAIQAFEKGLPLVIRNPTAVRPWQHVLDPIAGYLLLGQALYECGDSFSGAWNFGPGAQGEKSVAVIADTLTKLWGHPATWQHEVGNHPHEANFLKLNCKKARDKLNWVPKWPLSDSLGFTIDWYRAYEMGHNMNQFSRAQITSYRLT